MRINFQFLSRRWLRASGWVYVFSLALTALMYWMLPASSLIHRWTLSGSYHFDGFSRVDGRKIIVSKLTNRNERYQLDTITGTVNRWAATGEDSQQLITSQKLPYQLAYTSSFYHQPTDKLVLKRELDGMERNISSPNNHVEVDYVYASHGYVSYTTMSLSTSGMVAMSSDERWLILLSCDVQGWAGLKNWLIERTGWSLSFLPDGLRYTALIFDLQTDQITTCKLSTHFGSEFVIHPESTGFAAIELERGIMGIPNMWNEETIITWYALPPGPSYHSRNQWLLILGTFLTPILLAMFLHLIRRTRLPPFPQPASKEGLLLTS